MKNLLRLLSPPKPTDKPKKLLEHDRFIIAVPLDIFSGDLDRPRMYLGCMMIELCLEHEAMFEAHISPLDYDDAQMIWLFIEAFEIKHIFSETVEMEPVKYFEQFLRPGLGIAPYENLRVVHKDEAITPDFIIYDR